MIQVQLKNTIDEKKDSARKKRQKSKIYSQLKRDARPVIDKCIICGKENTSFCDSHSVPKFVLKQITNNGKIYIGHNFTRNPVTDDYGISNTLLFKCICEDCDNTYFKEYEDPCFFKRPLSNLAINEIAIKIYLRHYYKRLGEKNLFSNLMQELSARELEDTDVGHFVSNRLLITKLDLDDARNRIQKLIRHKDDRHFYVIDDFNLDYPTQLAYQGFIALTKGFGKIINDVHNYNPSYKMELLYLCVFPFKEGTKVVLFCDDGCTRLRDFYKTYKKLDLDSKLYLLNYILLLYDEEWCVSGDFDKSKLNKETLELINQSTDVHVESDSLVEIEKYYESLKRTLIDSVFELKTSGNVYNFLAKQNNV